MGDLYIKNEMHEIHVVSKVTMRWYPETPFSLANIFRPCLCAIMTLNCAGPFLPMELGACQLESLGFSGGMA